MKGRVLMVFALVLHGAHTFSVTQTRDSFKVSFGDTIVLDHSPESPMLFVGKGDFSITEDSGNYFAHDKIYSRLPLPSFKLSKEASHWRLQLAGGGVKAQLTLSSSGDKDLEITVDSVDAEVSHYWLRIAATPQEEIYGGGEQYTYVNLRERGANIKNVFPIWVNEQGIGRDKRTLTTFMADVQGDNAGGDYYTAYFPQPTFISSRNYFLHHLGTNYAVFDFSEDHFHEIFIYDQPGKIVISTADSFVSVVQSLARYLGHMPELPAWIQEKAVVSIQGGTDLMKEKYEIAKKHNIPVSGIWIQDWSGQMKTAFGDRVNWNWQWSKELYPGLDQLIKDWAKEGVRVLGYINPNLHIKGSLFKEAAAQGYLVKNSTGGVYLRRSITLVFGQVDFTNPAAYDWYKNVIKTNMIDFGLGGWMADFGEYLAVDAVLHDGRTGMQVHNEWPKLWAKLNREAVEESNKLGEVVFYTRSGFSGISNYSTLLWNGDQNVDFSLGDGVRSALYGSIGAGLNGMTFSHFDIGGYTTVSRFGLVRTRELLLRSAEFAVFTSVFRTHEGNEIASNIQWYTPNATADFAVHARNFARLADYRKQVGKESVASGLPTMRLTSLVFPNNTDPVPFDQYMFGNDLLVAPVYLEKATNRSVTFPKLPDGESWIHVWSGERIDGPVTMVVQAPMGEMPVYFRSGSTFKETFRSLKRPVPPAPKPGGDGAQVWGASLTSTLLVFGCGWLVVARGRE